MLKLLVGLAVACFLALNGALIFQAYYTNRKVQDCFDGVVNSEARIDVARARAKLQNLFSLQYLDRDDLPEEFYDELHFKVTGEILEVSSSYDVTVWPFGKVDAVDADGTYDPETLDGINAWRDKTRIDLSFEPYAISTSQSQ